MSETRWVIQQGWVDGDGQWADGPAESVFKSEMAAGFIFLHSADVETPVRRRWEETGRADGYRSRLVKREGGKDTLLMEQHFRLLF